MFEQQILKKIQRGRVRPVVFLGTVLVSVALATLVRLSLIPLLGPTGTPYVIYFIAVFTAASLLGFRGGILASALSIAATSCLFLRPSGPHHEWKSTQLFDLIVVVIEWFIISILGHSQLEQRARADAKATELEASEQHLRLATEGANVGTWSWVIADRKLKCSGKTAELLGISDDQRSNSDAFLLKLHPDDRATMRQQIASAVAERRDFDIEVRVVLPDATFRWLALRGHTYSDSDGRPVSIEGVVIDASERKRAEQNAEARSRRSDSLNVIGKAVREMREPKDIHRIALDEMAKTLEVDRCLVIQIDKTKNIVRFVSEWHRNGLISLCGDYSLADFDVELNEVFPDDSPLVVNDVNATDVLSSISSNMLKSLQISALIDVPMSRSGEVVSVLGVYMSDRTRHWTSDDVSFVEAVASQLTSAIEGSRMLDEAQRRAEREQLINRISDAMRITLDPEDIQEKAVTILGHAIGADRCYFAIYDLLGGEVIIGRDWHRPDLPSVSGVWAFPNTKGMFEELYPVDATSVVVDRDNSSLSPQTIENMKSLQIRSRISVAIADSRGMATLTACMADEPREWTTEDIQLMEKVASQLRVSVAMARVQSREHRIAADLQAALLPELPTSMPGLQIGSCMRPALDEAEIGGDFIDAFALDKGQYVLVIGDVSGKGLAAAGQLAMIRNSLRMSFYQHQYPAKSLETVNLFVTAHELLSGFVTILAVLYSSSTATITFCSCGHEPALLRRNGDDNVVVLGAEGLPLGVSEWATYTDQTVVLEPGDTLLMYTDGLSEAGPDRLQTLGTSGLAEILCSTDLNKDATEIATKIVDHVKAFANGNLRDDVCVLLARRNV